MRKQHNIMDYIIQEYQPEDVDEMIALGAEMHREGATIIYHTFQKN